MNYFPVFSDLSGQKVLIVGGGMAGLVPNGEHDDRITEIVATGGTMHELETEARRGRARPGQNLA